MESTGTIKTESRYWIALTFTLNVAIVAIMILIPMLYPEALSKIALTQIFSAPAPPPTHAPSQPSQPAARQQTIAEDSGLHVPAVISQTIDMSTGPEPQPYSGPGIAGGPYIGPGTGDTGVIASLGTGPQPIVRVEAPKGPVHVSGGVIAGMAISQPKPAYPAIAKAAGIHGSVVLHAVISKTGTIIHLEPVSGPQMLIPAAVDAVSQWRYRPYLLNGQPTEVETAITVNFILGS